MIEKKVKSFTNNIRLGFCFACRRMGIPGYQIHQIYLPKYNLTYIPIPKNACSTIKHLLYEIEFDREFDYDYQEEWGYRDIHDYYKKQPDAFTSAEILKNKNQVTTFVVVRDPVKRLISCYRNRVIDLRDLEKSELVLKHKGLPVKPDLNTFVLNLKEYRKANKIIEHHSRPQYKFLGNSLDYIDEVIPIQKLDILKELLQEFEPELKMRAEKSGGTSFGLGDLSSAALEQAIDFYGKDYDLLSDYYSPEQIRAEYKN